MTVGPNMGGGATPQMYACPKCGHQLAVGTPICGNCGTIQGGGGGTHVPEPLAASGIKPGAVVAALLVVAVAAGAFFARGAISDAIDSVSGAIDEAAEDAAGGGGNEGGGGNGGGGGNDGGGNGGGRGEIGGSGSQGGGGNGSNDEKPDVPIGYRHVGQIVRDIRAGGIPCTATRVDGSDAYLETGSCQSNGSHVQINIYFHAASLELAREFYSDFAFASVHADNWWVSGETTLMARIQKVLGGRLNRP
ncbi:MAG: zinc ribbon domain-containing protein [Actinomycetota bacterium]|nr:zinc ribbon domain-containing protein [Actinomycetota bacterium]